MTGDQHNSDSLEQFFRKKAGEYDVTFREEDWQKLEKELDLRDIKHAYIRKLRLLAAAAILIISLLGYFTYENRMGLNEIRQQMSEDFNPEAGQGPADDVPPPIATVPSDTQNNLNGADLRDQNNNRGIAERDAVTGDHAVREGITGEVTEREGTLINPSESVAGNPSDQLAGSEQADKPAGVATERPEAAIADASIPGVRAETWRIQNGHTIVAADIPPAAFSAGTSRLPVTKAAYISAADDGQWTSADDGNPYGHRSLHAADPFEGPAAWNAASRFTIGLVASPDLSTAGSLGNFQKPGHKIGFTIDYNLSTNLILSSGIIHSRVRYEAPGGSYNIPDFYNGESLPEKITGVCLLLDIPVTLRYYILNFSSSGLFVSTGLSSYIMLNEEYAYSTYQNGYRHDQLFSERTGSRHWLSNAGFSIGYERELTKNWSLRAEPFVRVPVRQVGWANVNLYSVGTFISVNYRL